MCSCRGYTLVEVLFALGLSATLAGIAVAQLSAGLDGMNTVAAARYLSARLQHTRIEAVRRNANTAVRFTTAAGITRHGVYVDGNGNGVLSRDIQRGVDRAAGPAERLDDQFPGVTFGALPGLPPVEPDGLPPGDDPIRLGASDMASFTPSGTATPGSIYLRGRRNTQLVVRVFGDTGKTRILKFHRATRTWTEL